MDLKNKKILITGADGFIGSHLTEKLVRQDAMKAISTDQTRIESLDWLRGIMAVSIMVYHFHSHLFYDPKADSVLGRLGIYAVSIFFVLSGLSIALVYNRFIKDLKTSFFFFIRRIFRIWPLIWVLIIFSVVSALIRNGSYGPFPPSLIMLNLTTLFGFISPGAYILTGTWSIGNEMVYYAFTPAIIWLFNRNRIYGNLFIAITIMIGLLFSFFILTPDKTLGQQWDVYINPFNNLFLYSIGVGIYYNFKGFDVNQLANGILLLVTGIAFVMVPYTGDQINLVTGFGRIAFSAMSISFVFGFYKLSIVLPRLMEVTLNILGMSTYSIYLLHPLVLSKITALSSKLNIVLGPALIFTLATMVTFAVSYISFMFLEKTFMRLGKRMTAVSPALSENTLAGDVVKS